MEILRIHPKDTYEIRNAVLRPKHFTQDYAFPGDFDESSFHLGGFVDKKLVSVTSFFYEKNPKFQFEHQYRLRGMATLEEYRGQGLSKALLKTAFPIIKQNLCQVLWCHAREKAIGFYVSVGFQPFGEIFELPDIGPHLLMYKEV